MSSLIQHNGSSYLKLTKQVSIASALASDFQRVVAFPSGGGCNELFTASDIIAAQAHGSQIATPINNSVVI